MALRRLTDTEAGQQLMANNLTMAEGTYEEVIAFRDRGAVLVLPIGSVEQHGPHLPISTDAIVATRLASRIESDRPIITAPTYNYGAGSAPRSGGGRHFAGSVGIPNSLLAKTLARVVSEYLRTGFDRILVLNGHMENVAPVFEALEENLGPGGRWIGQPGRRRAVHVNWWDFVSDADLVTFIGSATIDWGAEHAGILETSIMEALAPEFVRTEKKARGGAPSVVPYDTFPATENTLWPNGIGSSAVEANSQIGEALVSLVLGQIRDLIDREFSW
jgi:creatinine amidohydrolase